MATKGMAPLESNFLVPAGNIEGSFGRSCQGALDWALCVVGCKLLGGNTNSLFPSVGAVSTTLPGTSAMRLDFQRTEGGAANHHALALFTKQSSTDRLHRHFKISLIQSKINADTQ